MFSCFFVFVLSTFSIQHMFCFFFNKTYYFQDYLLFVLLIILMCLFFWSCSFVKICLCFNLFWLFCTSFLYHIVVFLLLKQSVVFPVFRETLRHILL